MLRMFSVLAAGALIISSQATGGTLTFQLIASYATSTTAPFGLAFDGANLWYGSAADNLIREMTTAGLDTGRVTTNPFANLPNPGLNALVGLGWTGSQLVGANGTTISYFDRVTGANRSDVPISPQAITGSSPGASLDFDHNEIWYAQDRSNVFRLTPNGTLAPGPNPVLGGAIGGAGAYSGVERVDILGNAFLIVMTAAFQTPPPNLFPFQICQETLAGVQLGCADFSRGRYRDLAFDGRYLYGALTNSGVIDKFDLLGPEGSILATPEPGGITLLSLGLLACVGLRRAIA